MNHSCTVKIVDDLPENRDFLPAVFEPEGHSPFQTTQTFAAVQCLEVQEAHTIAVPTDSSPGKDSEIQSLANRLERRNAELEKTASQLLQANHQLEKCVREQSLKLGALRAEVEAFNRSVVHDLRGPITAILGYSYLFQHTPDEDLPSIGRQHAAKIAKGAVRMEMMLREFIELADVNHG